MNVFKNKIVLTLLCIVGVVAVGLIGYFAYGSTMININNEKSINSLLATDKDQPITILAKDEYKNCAGVFYTDPIDVDDGKTHFAYFIKNPFYTNRYSIKGGGGGTNIIDCNQVQNEDNELIFFIYSSADKESKCSVFEMGPDLLTIRKLEEIDTPKGPFIMVKEYDLESNDNQISVYNGSLSKDDLPF